MRFSRLSRLFNLSATVLAIAAIPTAEAAEVTFRFEPPAGTVSVSVAGSFDDWNLKAHPMADPDDDGVWEVTIDLPAGSHQYKFVVNGRRWLTDESAVAFTDDGFGGKNSVIHVGSEPVTVLGTNAATGGVAEPSKTHTAVRFRFRPGDKARTVAVAGTFNDWSSFAAPMTDPDGDGIWETTRQIPLGVQQYKFVVNGSEWFADEHASELVDDGYGGKNSVVHVGPQAMVVGEPGGMAPGPAGSGVEVTFRFHPEVKHANSVSVVGSFNEWNAAAHPMQEEDSDGIWETVIRLQPGRYTYQFVIDGASWLSDATATEQEDDGFGGRRAVLNVKNDPIVAGVREQ